MDHRVYTGIALLLVVVMTVLLFQAEDKFRICLPLLIGCWLWLSPLPLRRWTLVDVCLCSITLYDVFSCVYAVSPVAAIPDAILSLSVLATYFVLRRLFASEQAGRLFLLGSYLPICAALLLALCSFFVFRRSVLGVGFEDTYHFRFLFRPLGYITNEWAEALLLVLGWFCLKRRYSALFVFLTVGAILLSFSRGVYIALGVYLVAWLLLVKDWRRKLRLPLICLPAVLLTMAFFPVEMRTTLQMNRTQSQRQSTVGRIHATQKSWNVFVERPWLGHGNGSYTMAIDKEMNQDSACAPTSIAPNIMVQLGIEKGICGLILYLLLLISLCLTLWKHWKHPESRVITSLFLALIVKEMTHATLLNTPFSLFMLYALLAYLQRNEVWTEPDKVKKRHVLDFLLPAFVLVGYLGYLGVVIQKDRNDACMRRSKEAFGKGRYAESVHLMKQGTECTSSLVNRGLLSMQCFFRTNEISYLDLADESLLEASVKQPGDVQIRYLRARLYLHKNELERAMSLLQELTTDYPKNSFYLLTLSEVYYQKGKKAEAVDPLVQAVRYMPRLLSGRYMLRLQQTDMTFYQIVKGHIGALRPVTDDTSIDYARYGYIARWCGNNEISDVFLRIAVSGLPNLATPWLLLGDEDKYRLLLYGAFHKDLLSTELPENKTVDEDEQFLLYYSPKFINWYGDELLSLIHKP